MNKPRIGFLLLAVMALLLATFLTWSLVNPKQVQGFYQNALGLPTGPQSEAIGKATIHFKKTEDEKNG